MIDKKIRRTKKKVLLFMLGNIVPIMMLILIIVPAMAFAGAIGIKLFDSDAVGTGPFDGELNLQPGEFGLPYPEGTYFAVTQGYWDTMSEAYKWWSFPPYKMHHAIDLSGAHETPIVAIADGQVISNYRDVYGANILVIAHMTKDNVIIYTGYVHLNYPGLVNPGDQVVAGQQIGVQGNTGFSIGGGGGNGSHLHLEMSTALDERGLYVSFANETSINPICVIPKLSNEKLDYTVCK